MGKAKTEKINTPDAKKRKDATGKNITEVRGYIAMFGMDVGGGQKLDPKDKLTLPKWMVDFLKVERDEVGILGTLQLREGEWPPIVAGKAPTKPLSPPPVPRTLDPRLLGSSERAHLISLLEKEKFTIKDDDILDREQCKKLRDKLSGVIQGSLFDNNQTPPTKSQEQIKKEDAAKAQAEVDAAKKDKLTKKQAAADKKKKGSKKPAKAAAK